MPRQSVQDILLEEIKQLREESLKQSTMLTRASTILDAIEQQTTKTNGRVNRLEERVNIHRGGIYVAYVIIAVIVLPLIIAWIK